MSQLNKYYFSNSDTKILLVFTAVVWTILIAGICNLESVLSSLGQSYYEDGLFSFLFAFTGCLMIVGLSIGVPIKIIKDWIKLKNTGQW